MINDIWKSFRNLPLWVQVWMVVILIPVNLAPIAFLGQPQAGLIAFLSIGGMALNLPIMAATRSMSKAMALPHLLFWGPMVIVVAVTLSGAADLPSGYTNFLIVLLVVDLISLAFDANDARHWLKEREAK